VFPALSIPACYVATLRSGIQVGEIVHVSSMFALTRPRLVPGSFTFPEGSEHRRRRRYAQYQLYDCFRKAVESTFNRTCDYVDHAATNRGAPCENYPKDVEFYGYCAHEKINRDIVLSRTGSASEWFEFGFAEASPTTGNERRTTRGIESLNRRANSAPRVSAGDLGSQTAWHWIPFNFQVV